MIINISDGLISNCVKKFWFVKLFERYN